MLRLWVDHGLVALTAEVEGFGRIVLRHALVGGAWVAKGGLSVPQIRI